MAGISNETFKAIKTDIGRIEELTQKVRESKFTDTTALMALAESIQLLASCVELLAMKVRQ